MSPKNNRMASSRMDLSSPARTGAPGADSRTRASDATAPAPLQTANVLNVPIHAINMPAALHHLANVLTNNKRGYVCLAGVHGVMEAQRDTTLIRTYENAALVTPDGMPTVWVGHLQGHKHMQQVTGPDLMLALMQSDDFAHCTHFLYGGKEGVAEELREQLTTRFPHIKIIGTYTPPFGELSLQEERKVIQAINAAKPDILWVGISTPRQERFMENYLPKLDVKLMFGVGAAFDFHTGRISDCAPWIKRCGMQWLHRLLQDPRRLWKRYLRNNPAFLLAITLQFLGLRSTREQSELSHSSPSGNVIVFPARKS